MLIILIVLGVLFAGLLIFALIHYFLQDKLLLHAVKLAASYEFQFVGDFEEMNLKMADGLNQNGILFKTNNSRGLIILLHGHSGNVEYCERMAHKFNKLHHDLLVIDYRSFGKSEGRFSEIDTFSDVKIWYSNMASIYPEQDITLYGKGIGSSFTAYLASEFNPGKMILESPLYDLNFTAEKYYPLIPFVRYIPSYKFDSASHINQIEIPVYLIHGKLNKLVHYENSTKLLALNREYVDLCLIEDGDHHNLVDHPEYTQYINQILRA